MIDRFTCLLFASLFLVSRTFFVHSDRDETTLSDDFAHSDCLFYRFDREEFSADDLSNLIDELIPYCHRPVSPPAPRPTPRRHPNGTFWTFEQLKAEGWRAEELFSLTSSIDLIEEYAEYLQHGRSRSNGRIWNCSDGSFGRFCEYSFAFSSELSMEKIVGEEFRRDRSDLLALAQRHDWTFPCFVHRHCRYIGDALCLDWREICDGEVQCHTNAIDEMHCEELELTRCADDEYRCHNGQCIPRAFLLNGFGESECLDRSDEVADLSYPPRCALDPSFRCEEHLCRKNWANFPCGDGQCVDKFRPCSNGRDVLLLRSGDTASACLRAMACLTGFPRVDEDDRCPSLVNNRTAAEIALGQCEAKFFFPSVPLVSDHVHLLYADVLADYRSNGSLLLPSSICFDASRCDCFPSSMSWKNLSCLARSQLDFFADEVTGENLWVNLVLNIHSHFHSCLSFAPPLPPRWLDGLYRCANSSKWIRNERIGDENFDCCGKEDELDESLRCSIDSIDRIRCSSGGQCYSSLHRLDDCPAVSSSDSSQPIPFPMLCDGFEQIFLAEPNGTLRSDETDCQLWPCDDLYSRCDHFWRCADGRDEENCATQNRCARGFHQCLSATNGTLICLPSSRVNDGDADCLGSTDEPKFCRNVYPLDGHDRRFRCSRSDLCLSSSDLCDGIRSCPHGDDELFCGEETFLCHSPSNRNATLLKDIFCPFGEQRTNDFASFSLQTSPLFPHSTDHDGDDADLFPRILVEPSKKFVANSSEETNVVVSSSPSALKWLCNRGLTTFHVDEDGEEKQLRCLCPPSYYGDRCQFENERISLTVGFVRQWNFYSPEVFLFLVLLVDETDSSLHSFVQFHWIPTEKCLTKFHRSLLYSSRPKDPSRNISVRIDHFLHTNGEYRGSWFYRVPWRFYPINRLVYSLTFGGHGLSRSSTCSPPCRFGQCVEYLNEKGKRFCHCQSGWKGDRCDEPIDCSPCSTNSFCFGSPASNESLCLCPRGRFGRRCSLESLCPPDRCSNGGEAISSDLHECLCRCPKEFFGSQCEHRRNELQIVLRDASLFDSYLTLHFLSILSETKTVERIFIEKLNLFQNEIQFHLAFSFHLVLVKIDQRLFLVVVQNRTRAFLRTELTVDRQCFPLSTYLNSTTTTTSRLDRLKSSHRICQHHREVQCFFDPSFICLCTREHHANCYPINASRTFACRSPVERNFCLNGGQCYQDDPRCPTRILCLCPDCFYGSQCQFYAKGLGLTLDEMLSSQIRSNRSFFSQNLSIQLIGLIVVLLFVYGSMNGVLCLFIFHRRTSRVVGSGTYLFVSSILLLLLLVLFLLKYFLLIESFRRRPSQHFLLRLNCFFVEPTQKWFVHANHWLNTSVAIERAMAVLQGIAFRKDRSQRAAKYFVSLIFLLNFLVYAREYFSSSIHHDQREEFYLCVINYSSTWHRFHSFLIYLQCFLPFFFNFSSALVILIGRTKMKFQLEKKKTNFRHELQKKLDQHKTLLLTPILLMIFSFPRLIFSLTLKCRRSFEYFWLHLLAYFLSFIPPFSMFFIFVWSSSVYKKEFHRLRTNLQGNLTSILRSSKKGKAKRRGG